MKCEEAESLMIDYLDKILSGDILTEFERHIGTCERCLDELRETQSVMKLLAETEMENPDESMRINFYHMLHSEIKKSRGSSNSESTLAVNRRFASHFIRIAAGFALLICGTLLGMFIHSQVLKSNSHDELSLLKSEVNSLKKMTIFAMLKDESSSDRIQAVNYVDDLKNPDQPVIDVLIKTLNNDRNTNVRMAAAYALAKFADQPAVCDSLVSSLSIQTDPILQVTLINILVERKEKRALKPIEKIISDKNTLEEVKTIARHGATLLI